MKPTGLGMRVFGRGASVMFSVLRRITGVDLLEDLAEFFQAFGGHGRGLSRARPRVNELLADDGPRSCWSARRRPSRSPRPSTSTASCWRPGCRSARVIVNRVHYEAAAIGRRRPGLGELPAPSSWPDAALGGPEHRSLARDRRAVTTSTQTSRACSSRTLRSGARRVAIAARSGAPKCGHAPGTAARGHRGRPVPRPRRGARSSPACTSGGRPLPVSKAPARGTNVGLPGSGPGQRALVATERGKAEVTGRWAR